MTTTSRKTVKTAPEPRVEINANEAALTVANCIIDLVRQKPDAVLGLATGGTMEPVYAHLVATYRRGEVSFAKVTSFNLDEYVGLPPSHPGSYRSTMNRLFFDHVDIDPSRTHLPDGMAGDPESAATAYEADLARLGPVDLQLLGIGRNGHIGFNEPGSALDSRTRQVELHASTLEANRSFFECGTVPHHAITMGIASILDARRIIVLATGEAKAEAVSTALSGTVSEACPASALFLHDQVEWVLDKAAAAGL
ncbi:glucosamine-6-phosphate deaminase [Rhizobium paknamense]|uniref:Glucosamine-6-phosphate deaminase n=1 Tax=Rhizobium paknamense TaxID=1206817 RepID=A0ABU0IEH1_9HYPH|nr:glucosamine-6-phosphate deaminase [Rhizobium paknamense]MDQ0455855.1 glucosamine-6-phosphate deaminase [Rhizobium paknamense]